MQYSEALRGWGYEQLRQGYPDRRLAILEDSVSVSIDRVDDVPDYYSDCACIAAVVISGRSARRWVEIERYFDSVDDVFREVLEWCGEPISL